MWGPNTSEGAEELTSPPTTKPLSDAAMTPDSSPWVVEPPPVRNTSAEVLRPSVEGAVSGAERSEAGTAIELKTLSNRRAVRAVAMLAGVPRMNLRGSQRPSRCCLAAFRKNHSTLPSSAIKSLSPASRTVIVETENGLPQAMPSSRLTIRDRCMLTSG